jgi:hypothetical protein
MREEDDNVRLERQVRRLTDDECDVFRRMPLSFNDMVRAIFEAGRAEERERYTAREAHLQTRINKLEKFICHSGGLTNEWAKTCPFGTKMTDHIKGKLYEWLKRN